MDVTAAIKVRSRVLSDRAMNGAKLAQLKYANRYPVTLGASVHVARTARFQTPTVVGSWTRIGERSLFKGNGPLSIGRFGDMGSELKVITSNHRWTGINMLYPLHYSRGWKAPMLIEGVTIGDAVWIGDRVTVLPGVTIGNGALIAACATVTSDVAPFSIVAGVPARTIRMRFAGPVVAYLQELSWWNWDADRITRNRELFQADLEGLSVHQIEDLVRP